MALHPTWAARFLRGGLDMVAPNAPGINGRPMTVSVSNHGGNGLDGAPATIRALPEVVAAAGDRLEVLLDGGVRRGGDVVKALALGARAVLVGRPYIWAMAVGGQDGVTAMLALFRKGIDGTLRLLAVQSVNDLGPEVLVQPTRVTRP